MLKKPTDELLSELKNTENIDSYIKNNEKHFANGNIAEYLNNIIKEKGIVKSKALKSAEINENYGYQIFMGTRHPSRNTLIQLCIGIKQNLDEIQAALKFAGYAPLYAKSKRDSIIISGIINGKSVFEINATLYDLGEETLS